MKTVAVFSYPDDAQIAVSVLRANGIEGFLPDEYVTTLNWFYTSAVGGIRLQVEDEFIDQARDVLYASVDPDLSPRCPHCGATNLRQLRIRWGNVLAIFLGFLLPGDEPKYLCQKCRKIFPVRSARHDAKGSARLEREATNIPRRDKPANRLPTYFLFLVGCFWGFALATALLPLRLLSDGFGPSVAESYAVIPLVGGICFYLVGYADYLRQKPKMKASRNKPGSVS